MDGCMSKMGRDETHLRLQFGGVVKYPWSMSSKSSVLYADSRLYTDTDPHSGPLLEALHMETSHSQGISTGTLCAVEAAGGDGRSPA